MTQFPIYEMFYSIQGEGYNTGLPAYFIRLAGCNVGCSFCDEKQAWQASNSTIMDVEKIIKEVETYNAQNVVITGGEPTLYDLTLLTKQLHNKGIKTFLETSGANKITGDWDWITLSPKQIKRPLLSCLNKANEIKIVIEKVADFDFAQQIAQNVSNNTVLCLQCEFSVQSIILPEIINYIKRNPQWRLSLQTHKMINIK